MGYLYIEGIIDKNTDNTQIYELFRFAVSINLFISFVITELLQEKLSIMI